MLLMQRFNENVLGKYDEMRGVAGRQYAPGRPMPKAEALREAKIWLRNRKPFQDPRYWVAFILIGDPE